MSPCLLPGDGPLLVYLTLDPAHRPQDTKHSHFTVTSPSGSEARTKTNLKSKSAHSETVWPLGNKTIHFCQGVGGSDKTVVTNAVTTQKQEMESEQINKLTEQLLGACLIIISLSLLLVTRHPKMHPAPPRVSEGNQNFPSFPPRSGSAVTPVL